MVGFGVFGAMASKTTFFRVYFTLPWLLMFLTCPLVQGGPPANCTRWQFERSDTCWAFFEGLGSNLKAYACWTFCEGFRQRLFKRPTCWAFCAGFRQQFKGVILAAFCGVQAAVRGLSWAFCEGLAAVEETHLLGLLRVLGKLMMQALCLQMGLRLL